MGKGRESDFAEVLFDRLLLESFPSESSAYHRSESEKKRQEHLDALRSRVTWHINHSLSIRQKEVLKLLLLGKREAEIGVILGVRQQVVNIYKHRAIKRLKSVLSG